MEKLKFLQVKVGYRKRNVIKVVGKTFKNYNCLNFKINIGGFGEVYLWYSLPILFSQKKKGATL